ncbi:MAG: UDP-N-acetylmuramate--L-alanine ligase [Pseudomonadota bacterium]
MRHKVERIHFVGIGGSGMSGIAQVFHTLGFKVSGSDLSQSTVTDTLREQGIEVFLGHHAEHVDSAEVVVTSTAITTDNPEVLAAKAKRIPVIPRAEMLAELMRFKRGIAVGGTHGKTTTTSLVASVLAEAGLDPTFVIGGRLLSAGAHARLGQGEYLVAEADESDASFLYLQPEISIVTNIDADHMETYGHDFERLKQTFLDFLHRLPFYGAAILCIDDENVASLLPLITKPIITYGMTESATIRASDIQAVGCTTHFKLHRPGREVVSVTLNLAGHHNVLNALSVVAVAEELGIEDAPLLKALAEFKGVGRRFHRTSLSIPNRALGETITLVDDYGHHPVEIQATLQAARASFKEQRIILVFQPHRYTRTRDLFEDFVRVLASADLLILTTIYAAGEQTIQGVDSESLALAIKKINGSSTILVERIEKIPAVLAALVRADDVVLNMGAGTIGQLPHLLQTQWQENNLSAVQHAPSL